MADEQTDSLLDAALDTSKDDDSYVLDDHLGEEGDGGDDAVSNCVGLSFIPISVDFGDRQKKCFFKLSSKLCLV